MTITIKENPVTSQILTTTSQAEFSGISAEILLGGDAAPMTVMEMTVAPGTGAPAHISFNEDKVFVITYGCLLFLIGEARLQANVGDHVFVAKGDIHSFLALSKSPARMTLISTPSHHDCFFRALSDLPVPHDQDEIAEVCIALGQIIVGPMVQP